VACGEASSSVSSTNTGNGSVSSVSSAYANVTTVTLSAASNLLTQVLGTQQRVTVTAVLNANTNPNLSLEWFVNGVKQAQTGRIFDFTPTAAGSFAITAKVGNLNSNTLTVTATAPSLTIEEVEFVKDNQVKVTAPSGANISLVGAELADSSFYSLIEGKYVLNLKQPLAKGANLTIRLEREGFQTTTETIKYDLGKFSLTSVTLRDFAADTAFAGVVANGVYTIVKPFDAGAQFVKSYSINLSQTNVIPKVGTVALTTQLTVPTGATAVAPSTQLVDSISSFTFNVDTLTVAGLYTHKFVLDGKEVEVKVNVEESKPFIELNREAFVSRNLVTGLNSVFYDFEFRKDLDGNGDYAGTGEKIPVTKDASGAYVVEKLNSTYDLAEFAFVAYAGNIAKPEFADNQLSVSVAGPDLFGTVGQLFSGINTVIGSNGNQTALGTSAEDFTGANLPVFLGSTDTSHSKVISQKIDHGTPAGTYTFTIKAGEFGKEITRDIVVKIVEPAPRVDFVFENLTSGAIAAKNSGGLVSSPTPVKVGEIKEVSPDVYEIVKPLNSESTLTLPWFTVLTNYQSKLVTDFATVSADNLLTDLDLRKTWNKDSKIKLTDADLNSGNLFVRRGATSVPVFAEVNVTAAGTITVTETDASEISTPEGTLTGGATDSVGTITLGTTGKQLVKIAEISSTVASDNVGDFVSFAIAQATGTITVTATPLKVVLTDYPNVIELGSKEFATNAVAGTDAVPGIASQTYSFVNVSLATTGPATLVKPFPTTRAAILLGINDGAATVGGLTINGTDAHPTDGLVLFQGGTNNLGNLETAFTKYLSDKDVAQFNAFGTVNTRTFVYNLDHLGAAEADLTPEFTTANIDTGLKRGALEIKSSTVAGTYTMSFTVDNLVRTVTLIVKNPQPEVNIISRTTDIAGATKVAVATANETTHHFRLSGPLSNLIEHTSGKSVPELNGVYTVEKSVNDYLKAEVAVFNLAVGRYNYSITKKYPDGRTDTFNDLAIVTRIDENGRSLFEQTSAGEYRNTTVSAADSALNAALLTRWFIDTKATNELGSSSELEPGTYEYTFTLGPVTKKYVINVIGTPGLVFNSVTIDGTELESQNGVYFIDVLNVRGNLNVEFAKLNLPATTFVTLTTSKDPSNGSLTVPAAPIVYTNYLSLTTQTKFDLGNIGGTLPANGTLNTLRYLFKFYRIVNFDSAEYVANSSSRYVELGSQVLEIRAMTTLATPIQANVASATKDAAISQSVGAVGAERVYYTLDGSTPTLTSAFVTADFATATIPVPSGAASTVTTVKYFAVRTGFKPSAVHTFTVTRAA
jgi:hypothetical protein